MTQRASTFTLWVVVTILLALPASAKPIGATEERIPVTDPSLLEELGLEPDARNIYVTPEVHAYLLMSPAERAAVEAAATALDEGAASEPEASSAFGDTTGITTIHASDFAPSVVNASTDYQVGGTGGAPGEQLWCNEGNTTFVGVFRDLPHGARATVRRIWYYDNDDIQNITVWLQRTCLPFFSAAEPETTILATNTSNGTPEYGRFGPGNFLLEDIDGQSCVYALRARLGNGGACAAGGNLRLLKASLSWQRQLSPAPDSATFDDVPTGHIFFPHIEALAGSGITSGCDVDSFCPNAPLTRGQMAAFLATALGLNWDGPFWEP